MNSPSVCQPKNSPFLHVCPTSSQDAFDVLVLVHIIMRVKCFTQHPVINVESNALTTKAIFSANKRTFLVGRDYPNILLSKHEQEGLLMARTFQSCHEW